MYREQVKYRGLCYVDYDDKYKVSICVNGKRKYLGLFRDPVQAAKVYDEAAKKYRGPKAKLNFPENK